MHTVRGDGFLPRQDILQKAVCRVRLVSSILGNKCCELFGITLPPACIACAQRVKTVGPVSGSMSRLDIDAATTVAHAVILGRPATDCERFNFRGSYAGMDFKESS